MSPTRASGALFVASAEKLEGELTEAEQTFTGPEEKAALSQLREEFDAFMALDVVAWRELRAGNDAEVKRILLGPELVRFEAAAASAERLANLEAERADAADAAFDDDRDQARKRLIAVALGARMVIILLLVTAQDVARLALEGERRTRRRSRAEGENDASRMTEDVLLTLSLLLSAALAARFLASLIRVPEMLVLMAFGALLGPSVARRGRRPV